MLKKEKNLWNCPYASNLKAVLKPSWMASIIVRGFFASPILKIIKLGLDALTLSWSSILDLTPVAKITVSTSSTAIVCATADTVRTEILTPSKSIVVGVILLS